MFVAEICRLLTALERSDHLAVLVPSVEAETADAAEFEDNDEFDGISPQDHAARCERLALSKQMFEAEHLGTS